MSADDVIKVEFMVKRAQMKGRFKADNYKSRWFVLTRKNLRYHDGTLEDGQGREKGRLCLENVRLVEKVTDYSVPGRANGFQIIYEEQGCKHHQVLYVFANSSAQQEAWIEELIEASRLCGSSLMSKYHPDAYISGKYKCCDAISKSAPGCTSASHAKMINRPIRDEITSRDPMPPPVPEFSPVQSTSKPYFVIAMYDYQRSEEGDLSLIKGEEYKVLPENSKEHWLYAQNNQGEEGYIPANYVNEKTEQGLENYEWYYKGLTRGQSEEMLRVEAKPGCFLVRESSKPGMYTLSVFTQEVPEGKVRHYHIKQNEAGQYFFSDRHEQATVPELIHYHRHHAAGLAVRLRSAASRSDQPATSGLGHGLVIIKREDLRLEHELGSGHFGTVKKGVYKNTKDVAVKMMKPGSMSIDDFLAEAKAMKELTHENLVQLYGICNDENLNQVYIVTEYMQDGALVSYLRRHKRTLQMKADQLLSMCVNVCNGMKYLESKNFIHRDLAARNCLVTRDKVVKVGDFGLARFLLDDEYTSTAGTQFPIRWSPPEVLSYLKFSTKSDVWSFGILMWEIYTGGDLPYGQIKNTTVVENVLQKNHRLSQPDSCPDNIYGIMNLCWKVAADERPAFTGLHARLLRVSDERDHINYSYTQTH